MKIRTNAECSVKRLRLDFEFETPEEFDTFRELIRDIKDEYEYRRVAEYVTIYRDYPQHIPQRTKAYLKLKEDLKEAWKACFSTY